jgi:hypothetical protein
MAEDEGHYYVIEANSEHENVTSAWIADKLYICVSALSPHSRNLFPPSTRSEEKGRYLKITLINIVVSRLGASLLNSHARLVAADRELGS